jgi:hypothetical protein
LEFGKFTSSNVVTFPPSGNADPGPSVGSLTELFRPTARSSTDPVSHCARPARSVWNNGVVTGLADLTPPWHQFMPAQRELGRRLALRSLRAINKDMFWRAISTSACADTSCNGQLI